MNPFWFNRIPGNALDLVSLAPIPEEPLTPVTKRFKVRKPTECAICLEEDCKPRRYFGHCCSHHFHVKCLKRAFKSGARVCPVCRANQMPPNIRVDFAPLADLIVTKQ